jgi:hypothetical protein
MARRRVIDLLNEQFVASSFVKSTFIKAAKIARYPLRYDGSWSGAEGTSEVVFAHQSNPGHPLVHIRSQGSLHAGKFVVRYDLNGFVFNIVSISIAV